MIIPKFNENKSMERKAATIIDYMIKNSILKDEFATEFKLHEIYADLICILNEQ